MQTKSGRSHSILNATYSKIDDNYKTMKYINKSEETLYIPSVGTIKPSEVFETELKVADERI